jgi:uncharacterized protein YutE (UPF0331/DUF86 family)
MPITASDLERYLRLQWAVERGLQISAESLFDTGNHVLAGGFRETTDHHADVRRSALGVITAAMVERPRGFAGLRNVIVQEYADIDPGKIVAALHRLGDLEAFAADVAA